MNKKNLILVGVASTLIILIISYNYSVDQSRAKGFAFGNELQQIQEDLKKLQNNFNSQVTMWKEGEIKKEKLLEYSKNHLSQMEELLKRYDRLSPPEPFVSSVELFKLSTEIQIQSDKEFIMWIESADESHMIRSDDLLQDSFDYEMAALGKFNEAKKGNIP